MNQQQEEECAEAQENECVALEAMYGLDFEQLPRSHDGETSYRLAIHPSEEQPVAVKLVFILPQGYPFLATPTIRVENCCGMSNHDVRKVSSPCAASLPVRWRI